MLELTQPLKRAQSLPDYAAVIERFKEVAMPDDAYRRALRGVHDNIAASAHLADTSRIAALAAQMEGHKHLLAGMMPDLVALRSMGLDPSYQNLLRDLTSGQKRYEELFCRPELNEIGLMARQAAEAIASAVKLYGVHRLNRDIEVALGSLREPWLHTLHIQQSITAIAEMQAIGQAVNSEFPYAAGITSGLRHALGDWRNVTRFPTHIFENPVSRSDFYLKLGFSAPLTDLPAPAFDESSALAGLSDGESDFSSDAEEGGMRRNHNAYRRLLAFERQLRRFIDQVMTAAFGADWIERRTPPNMLGQWIEKRTTAVGKGESEQPLICYADFSDYVQIIQRRDNWAEVFKPIFGRAEDVRESFTRLSPIRIVAMHARLVTLDDELLLRVETTRILSAISRANKAK
jgi:hypothetical protein